MTTLSTRPATPARDCSPGQRATRALLGYGIVAGPFYVGVSLTQALLQPGFDLRRHDWSLLAAGPHGWIQTANLVLTGAMVTVFAVGLRRSQSSRWGARLVGAYGVGLAAAGLLVADPMAGYPVGAPTPATPSWHAIGHLVVGGLGFLALIVGGFLLARAFARAGSRAMARWSRITAVAFGAGFVGVASGSGSPVVVLAFTAAVLAVWTWLAGVARHLYRSV